MLVALALPAAAQNDPGADRPASESGDAAGVSLDDQPVVLLVLPFRIHTARPSAARAVGARLRAQLTAERGVELVSSPRVDELFGGPPDPDDVAALGDAALKRLADRSGAAAAVTGSLTDLAGRFSLDVRVTPAAAGARSQSVVFTAGSEAELESQLDEIASRIVASASGPRARIDKIVIDGVPSIEEELREKLATRVGEPFVPARVREDRARLEAHPDVASVSVETVRSDAGVELVFRVVASARLLVGPSDAPSGELVGEVRVTGNRRIEADAILARIRTRAGEPFSSQQLAKDVREVFALGFFRNVRVLSEQGPEGRILTFDVDENPVIRQISISGNENVDSDKIRDALTLTTGSTLDQPLLHENVARIGAIYRAEGYYLADVGFKIETITDGSVGIIFEVAEGEKLKLRTIAFEGNEAFTDKELADGLATKRWRIWSYVTKYFDKSGTYSEPVFMRDLREVERRYTDNGYLQVEVAEPVVTASEDGLSVMVPVREGPQFHVGDIDVQGDQTMDTEALRGKLALAEGDVFNRSFLTADVESLERHYTDRGFYFAKVEPRTRMSDEGKVVDVDFAVEKGPLYFVRHVDISGNKRTVDHVVRRELQVVEGQLYSARALQISDIRARNLGFFETVTFEPRPTEDPSQLDLDVRVVERPTGSFSFGAGFSSQDGFIVTASLAQANLFGRGYGVNLSADIGGRTNRFFLTLSDPYFMGSTFSLGGSIFYTDVEFEDFEQTQLGFDINIGHALREDNTARGFARYSFALREVSRDSRINAAAVIFREILQGRESSSLLGLTFTSDTRNDQFAPTAGTVYGATIDYAGLGGFSNFLRLEGRYKRYFGAPRWLFKGSSFVFATRIGYTVPFNTIDDFDFALSTTTECQDGSCINIAPLNLIDTDVELPLTERYFLGGIGAFQLRGYRARSVGPRRAILRRTGLGEGDLFLPVGTRQEFDPVSNTSRAVCDDRLINGGNPNQGNTNGLCNDITDRKIDDFEDIEETDVIGGNSFITSTFEYRFPISNEVGLQGVIFADMGNAFAEGDNLFDVTQWRYGFGGGLLWFSPFGPLQVVLGFPLDPLPIEDSPVFEFSVGGIGL